MQLHDRTAAFAALFVVAGATATAAQRLDSLPVFPIWPGNTVRVALRDRSMLEGRVRTVSPMFLVLQSDSSLAIERIDSLWVRHTRTLEGTLIGASAGLVLAAFATGSVFEGPYRPPGSAQGLKVLGGSLIGALIGASIGSDHITWERLFP